MYSTGTMKGTGGAQHIQTLKLHQFCTAVQVPVQYICTLDRGSPVQVLEVTSFFSCCHPHPHRHETPCLWGRTYSFLGRKCHNTDPPFGQTWAGPPPPAGRK